MAVIAMLAFCFFLGPLLPEMSSELVNRIALGAMAGLGLAVIVGLVQALTGKIEPKPAKVSPPSRPASPPIPESIALEIPKGDFEYGTVVVIVIFLVVVLAFGAAIILAPGH